MLSSPLPPSPLCLSISVFSFGIKYPIISFDPYVHLLNTFSFDLPSFSIQINGQNLVVVVLSAIMRSFAIRRPKIRSMKDMLPKADWLLKAQTVNHAIGHPTKTFDDSNRAPSFGCVVGDRGISIPTSINSSYDAAPSYSEVALRDASQSDESHVGKHIPMLNFQEARSILLSFGEIYLDDGVIVCVSHNADWKEDWKYKNATYRSIWIEEGTTYSQLIDVLFEKLEVDKLKYDLRLEVPYIVNEQSYIPVHFQNRIQDTQSL